MKFEQMPINWFLLRAVGDLFLVWVRWAGTEEGGLSPCLPSWMVLWLQWGQKARFPRGGPCRWLAAYVHTTCGGAMALALLGWRLSVSHS